MTSSPPMAPRYRWTILGVNFLFLSFASAGLSVWSVALPQLINTFSLSPVQAQLGSATLMAGCAAGNFCEALLAARIGLKKTGLLAAILLLIPQFVIPMAASFTLILLLRFVQGFGIVCFVTVSMTAAWFPLKERELASCLIGGAVPAGIGLGGIITAGLLHITSTWQQAFTWFGIIVLIVAFFWAMFAKDAPTDAHAGQPRPSAGSASGMKMNPFTLTAGWLAALCLFCNVFQLVGFGAVLPGYMYDLHYSPVEAGTILFVCGLVGLLSAPLGAVFSGWLAAKGVSPIKAHSYTMAIPGFCITGVACLAFPFIAPAGYANLMLTAVIVCWGVPLTNASIGALPLDMLKNPDIVGKLFGMTIFIGLSGAVIAPLFITFISSLAGWTTAFIVLGVAALAGAALGIIIPGKFTN